MEVDYLHQGSEFGFMSTISIIFVVTSSLSCMNRELVLTRTDGRVFIKKIQLNQAFQIFHLRGSILMDFPFLGANVKG